MRSQGSFRGRRRVVEGAIEEIVTTEVAMATTVRVIRSEPKSRAEREVRTDREDSTVRRRDTSRYSSGRIDFEIPAAAAPEPPGASALTSAASSQFYHLDLAGAKPNSRPGFPRNFRR